MKTGAMQLPVRYYTGPHSLPFRPKLQLPGALILFVALQRSFPVKAGGTAPLARSTLDGPWLSFPKIVALGENQYAVHVMLINLASESYTVRSLIPDSEVVSDVEAVWRSDSQGLIVARQPPARKIAQGSVLYSVDLATGEATLLVPDAGFEQTNLIVQGDLLVFQRVALGHVMARPELWVYDHGTRELRRIAQNGVSPRWLVAPDAIVH
jgi:hypothetical protein